MNETPHQYTARMLSYQRGKAPIRILASTPVRISKLLRAVPRAALRWKPGPGHWSVAEILSHLADAEMVFSFRLRQMLGSSGIAILAYDQDVWAGLSRGAKHEARISLDAFRSVRDRNVRLLRSIPKKMWGNYGIHEERGKETVKRLAEMVAGHDINHMRQIEGILRHGQTHRRSH